MDGFFKWLDKATDWLEIIATSVMVILIFIQVVFRYVFNNALPWPEEIARYLFCWSTYLAVCISIRGDRNLRITILLDALGPRLRKWLNMSCCVVNICLYLLLVYLTFSMMMQVRELDEMMISMAVPVWLAWAGLPVCFVLISIQAMRNLYLVATDRITVQPDTEA